MAAESLSWLPPLSSRSTATALEALPKEPDPGAWDILVKLAQYQLDLTAHDPARPPLCKLYPVLPTGLSICPVRLAVLDSGTLGYLLHAIAETPRIGIDALLARTLIAAKGLPLTLTWPRSASCAEISRSKARLPSRRFQRNPKVDASGYNVRGVRQGCTPALASIFRPEL